MSLSIVNTLKDSLELEVTSKIVMENLALFESGAKDLKMGTTLLVKFLESLPKKNKIYNVWAGKFVIFINTLNDVYSSFKKDVDVKMVGGFDKFFADIKTYGKFEETDPFTKRTKSQDEIVYDKNFKEFYHNIYSRFKKSSVINLCTATHVKMETYEKKYGDSFYKFTWIDKLSTNTKIPLSQFICTLDIVEIWRDYVELQPKFAVILGIMLKAFKTIAHFRIKLDIDKDRLTENIKDITEKLRTSPKLKGKVDFVAGYINKNAAKIIGDLDNINKESLSTPDETSGMISGIFRTLQLSAETEKLDDIKQKRLKLEFSIINRHMASVIKDYQETSKKKNGNDNKNQFNYVNEKLNNIVKNMNGEDADEPTETKSTAVNTSASNTSTEFKSTTAPVSSNEVTIATPSGVTITPKAASSSDK